MLTQMPAAAAPSSAFNGPLFLVGMPRSGTKLLRELLNRHPRIGIPDAETEFLPWLCNELETLGDVSTSAGFERLVQRIRVLSFFTYRERAGRPIDAARWHAACRSFDAAGIFEALVRLDTQSPAGSDRIWGDKSPSYIDDLPLIQRLYPDVRVVHIVRDVRDHCLSMRDAWGKDMRRAAQRWVDGVTTARNDGRALGARYLEIRYEDLLADTEAVLRRICDCVSIDFDPRMLVLERPSENLGQARGEQRVVSDNQGKFRTRLAPAELAQIEAIAGETLTSFGYALALAPQALRRLSRWEMLQANVFDGVELVRRRRRELGLAQSLAFYWRYFVTTRS